jgi:uncharacterized repeat protein (TIGR01451 family)
MGGSGTGVDVKKWWATGVAVAVGLSVVAPGVAHAADKVIVVPGDFVPSQSDTRATGRYEVTGTGLRIYTTGATSTDKVAEYVATNVALADVADDLAEPSLDYSPTVGSSRPGFQLIVDFGGGDPSADGILVGEPVYNGDWWVNNAAEQFVKDGAPTAGGGSGSTWHGTLDAWSEKFPAARVLYFGFSLGSGVHGDGVINAINFNNDRYTFTDKAPDTTPPTVICDTPEPQFPAGSTGTVTATVTDAGSGPAQATVSASADTSTLGTRTVTLTGADNSGNTASQTCSYTVVVGAPASITLVSGGGQTAAVGTAFAEQVKVRVADSLDNPVEGAVVTFGAPATGASGTYTSPTVTTGADGVASVSVSANGNTGTWQGTATTSGTGAAATFSLTNTPAPPKKADLRVTMTGPAQLSKKQSGTYTVTVRNVGPDAATDVVTSAVLPTGLVSVTSAGGGKQVGSLVVWPTVRTLASGSSTTYTVTVKATAKGSGAIAAAAASLRTGDPVLSNNAAIVKLAVR